MQLAYKSCILPAMEGEEDYYQSSSPAERRNIDALYMAAPSAGHMLISSTVEAAGTEHSDQQSHLGRGESDIKLATGLRVKIKQQADPGSDEESKSSEEAPIRTPFCCQVTNISCTQDLIGKL